MATRRELGRRRRWRAAWLASALGVAAVACTSGDPDEGRSATPTPSTSAAQGSGTVDTDPATAIEAAPPPGPALLDGPSVTLMTLRESPYVGAAAYPLPDHEGNPWSQWGQAIALGDGRVISAVGDHLGADGNSYLYQYDPEARSVTRFADVLSAVPHQAGEWGYGKIHSQMVDPGDGGVWFSTFWGSRRGLTYGGDYTGDVLFRLDQATLALSPVSVPVPGHGMASLATDGNGLIYGEPIDPLVDDSAYPVGGSAVIDVRDGTVTSFPDDPRRDVFRSIMVAADGRAWFAGDDGTLLRYDPAGGELTLDEATLPASLRAATAPNADGTIYGVTQEPYRFFAFRPGEPLQDLGAALAYTASLALLPDGSAFLYVPGAHGDAATFGAPLIAVDTATGEQTTIVELADLVTDQLGVVLGGTYSITVDPERNEAHIGFNAGPTADEPWGQPLLVVVALP